MRTAAPLAPRRARLARWSLRLAIFSAAILLTTVLTHRFGGLPTPLALNLVVVSLGSAVFAILAGVAAAVQIWINANTGAWSAALGVLFGVPLALWPLAHLPTVRAQPEINDISTDLENVPRFVMLAQNRPEGATRPQYPGAPFARAQAQAHPDLKPLIVDRSIEETHDLVYEAMRSRRGLNWRIVNDEIPSAATRPPKPGFIEATERSLIMGFTDDIVVRIVGDGAQSRVDIRSKSRFGRHDLGANAARVRRFLREMQARLEATAPAAIAARGRRPVDGPALQAAAAAAAAKRPRDRNSEKSQGPERAKSEPSRVRPDGSRAPQPKGQPRE